MFSIEGLQSKHRQEQRDLQGRITQKKKSATKKTRKGVNDECSELERQLGERQAFELSQLTGHVAGENIADQTAIDSAEGENKKSGEEDGSTDDRAATLPNPTPMVQNKKPNRQKMRLARRAAQQDAAAAQAAQEAASLPNLREEEQAFMLEAFRNHNLKEHVIRPDGHCLYSAIADQLTSAGISLKRKAELDLDQDREEIPDYRVVRHVAASYMAEHPDDFLPFMEVSLQEYTESVRNTAEWGGQLELLALSKAYSININVFQGDGRIVEIRSEEPTTDVLAWLAYYRHTYGLGEHYNSLHKKP